MPSAVAAAARRWAIFDWRSLPTRIDTNRPMMSMARLADCLILLLALTCFGCSPSGQVKVYPVKGRVTFEGKPMVGGGAISFIPKADERGKTAGGIIQPDGSYVLA